MTRHLMTAEIRGRALAFVALLLGLSVFVGVTVASASPKSNLPGAVNVAGSPTVTPTICATGWTIVETVDPDPLTNDLYSVDALSANDVWAVGTAGDGTHTLIKHWDGNSWSVTYSPILPAGTVLRGVSAVSANDVWAVGYYFADGVGGTNGRTITLHYNGQEWSVVPSPNPGLTQPGSKLYAVDGVSANDVWAVGTYYGPLRHKHILMHWDGTQWTLLPGEDGILYDVVARAGDDVWAVGGDVDLSDFSSILHWDGVEWSTSPHPLISSYQSLHSVSAIGPDDVWVVGQAGQYNHAFSLHWNGQYWSRVAQPYTSVALQGMAALAPDDVWAVSDLQHYHSDPPGLVRWDGNVWSQTSIPLPDPEWTTIRDMGAVPSGELWAVGVVLDGQSGQTHTVLAHYRQNCGSATPTPTACATGWHTVFSPSPGGHANVINDVVAISDTDVWSVGFTSEASSYSPMIQHWDGTQWDIVPSDNLDATTLYGVVSFEPNDIWATGGTNTVLHWDGIAWTQVTGPEDSDYSLLGIDGMGSNDLWVVGGTSSTLLDIPLFHWNGVKWTGFDLPMQGALHAVKAISANDVWAVGMARGYHKLLMHWDGVSWSQVSIPGPLVGELFDVDALSATDVWVVGASWTDPFRTYIIHWDGAQWSLSDMPPSPSVAMHGVSAVEANNVWAVGEYGGRGVTMHWDGSTWQIVSSPDTDWSELLLRVDALPDGRVWAVGKQYDNAPWDSLTLTQRYDPCTVNTPTPTPSSTPTGTFIPTNTPTNTRTNTPTNTPANTATATTATTSLPASSTAAPSATSWATGVPVETSTYTPTRSATATLTATLTATATPSVCAIQFADVPDNHTFYTFVRCLACRGILSGYSCGGAGEPCNGNNDPYFRSSNGVTRGQLSKIVSESAGFGDPVAGQTFEDVPKGSTFYEFIERLAAREVMQGYACGGVGEPCGPGNRPYFRPNAGATRGQLAKIVSNAMEWADLIPGGQFTFADVPEGSTFHLYVERLLMHRPGAMQGYACGGAGEPCDQHSRPYFRPGNTLTRGQTAKIIANSFFPACVP